MSPLLLTKKTSLLTLFLVTKCLWGFPCSKQFSATLAGCPVIQFDSDSICLVLASDPTGEELSPTGHPSALVITQKPVGGPVLSQVLLTHQSYAVVPSTPSFCPKMLEWLIELRGKRNIYWFIIKGKRYTGQRV